MMMGQYCIGIKMDVHLNSNDAAVAFVIGLVAGMFIGAILATALLNKV